MWWDGLKGIGKGGSAKDLAKKSHSIKPIRAGESRVSLVWGVFTIRIDASNLMANAHRFEEPSLLESMRPFRWRKPTDSRSLPSSNQYVHFDGSDPLVRNYSTSSKADYRFEGFLELSFLFWRRRSPNLVWERTLFIDFITNVSLHFLTSTISSSPSYLLE